MAETPVATDKTPENEGNNWRKRAAASHMHFWKRPPYLRERKPHHLRVDRSSGPETPLDYMTLMQASSPQGERGAYGPESPLGRIIQQSQRNLISLIYTPTRTNESTHILKEVQAPRRDPSPTPPCLLGSTKLPQEKLQSGSPFLTCSLTNKKYRDMYIGIQYIQCRANIPAQDAPLYWSLWLFHRRPVCQRYRSRWLVHRTMRRQGQSHLRECAWTTSKPHLMTLPLLLRTVEDSAASKQQRAARQ